MTFEEFKSLLTKRTPKELFQECLLDSFPYCFLKSPTNYLTLRKEICDFFKIHPQNFSIIGSAKTGFSLSPLKFGREFCETSDIDVVLVSEELFQTIWLDLIEFQKTIKYNLDPVAKSRFGSLQYTLFFGILRLDKLSDDFAFAKKWWEFFNRLSVDTRFGPRRIRGTIFKSWQHVSYYYEKNIKELGELK